MRLLSFLFGLVFVGFAIVQYNDPDRFVWILAYGYVAMLSLLSSLQLRTLLPAAAGLLFYASALFRAPASELVIAPWSSTEVANESAGLVLCIAWSAVLIVLSIRQHGFKI